MQNIPDTQINLADYSFHPEEVIDELQDFQNVTTLDSQNSDVTKTITPEEDETVNEHEQVRIKEEPRKSVR